MEARWSFAQIHFSVSRYVWIYVLVVQSCLTLRNPMDCSPPGSSVHGILQARILAWVVLNSLLQGIFSTQGSNPGLQHCRQVLYHLSHQGSPYNFWLFLWSHVHNWERTTGQLAQSIHYGLWIGVIRASRAKWKPQKSHSHPEVNYKSEAILYYWKNCWY